jgi:hypothetical protein
MINLIIYAVIGGAVGVLINYLSDVLPRTRRFSQPICPHCEVPFSLKGYLISFKCPNCGQKPRTRNFLVLITSIIAAVLVIIDHGRRRYGVFAHALDIFLWYLLLTWIG